MTEHIASLDTVIVLRLAGDGSAWLDAARRAPDPPEAVRALLHGRTRVETTLDEAALAVDWASRLDGWSKDSASPFTAYRLSGAQAEP